ncbi:glycosyltransferase family 4 protein [Devosia rhizoryzae]|uniref:glycosyltransferase family 4 protein n=1 Tax=Devosia rhizoryzae TaxID=2774137 RepID=UPI001E34A414|nr:glycosyltransferase family 4 protein [Devosia rhizoryzae]
MVISDFVEPQPSPAYVTPQDLPHRPEASTARNVPVLGGYLERLPLAAVRNGLADFAEIWHHHRGNAPASLRESDMLTRRSFPMHGEAPFHSDSMIDFVRQHGAPAILAVWGLGVSEALLEACGESFIIYNSIDAPSLRVPPEVSQHFDLVITGAQWQSDEVEARHPGMQTAIMPIGPEFASPETFFPLAEIEKRFDVIYVAAAQPYKRHDVLLNALARSPRPLKALCVIGYGEDSDRLRHQAAERGLDVEFVGPPGVSHAEVNRLMNAARVGVVCGVDDGAPAILTEYMLAGLPVVANAELRCGLQYILPQTGIAVPGDRFEQGIIEALGRSDFSPRQTVLDRWTWPHSISKLADLIAPVPALRAQHAQLELV